MPQKPAIVVAAALALSALFWIDALFIPLVVLGPILTGILAGPTRLKAATAVWALAGFFALLSDWAINDEDQIFHLAVAAITAGLTYAVGSAANAIRARRHPTESPAASAATRATRA